MHPVKHAVTKNMADLKNLPRQSHYARNQKVICINANESEIHVGTGGKRGIFFLAFFFKHEEEGF